MAVLRESGVYESSSSDDDEMGHSTDRVALEVRNLSAPPGPPMGGIALEVVMWGMV